MIRTDTHYIGRPVRSLQTMLRTLSYVYPFLPRVTPDGIFGERTLEAVMRFQREHGLAVTGRVDLENWEAVAAAPEQDHLPRTTLPEFTEKLRRAVTALKSAGVQPVLMTLPPIDGQRYFRFISQKTDGGSVLRWLGDVGRIYRHQELYSDAVAALAFAEGVPLIDVRRQFLPQRDLSGLIAADGIHLTMSGYRCLFDTLADWVRARL